MSPSSQDGAAPKSPARPPGADRRPAEMADLRHRLRRSTGGELSRLVIDHGRHFGLPEIRQMLANVHVTGEAIEELLAHRRLVSIYEVSVAIARHPKTPEPRAMRLIPSIRWRDLLEIAVDTRIRAGTRRAAERYLQERLPRLTLGEKIALARRSPAGLAPRLGTDANLRVLGALLGNQRLGEKAVVAIVTDPRVGPRHLDEIARHPRWGRRYAVRAALCRNPKTPFRVLFEAMPSLHRADIEAVADLEDHAEIVRQRARDLLAAVLERAEDPLLLSEDGMEPVITIDSD